MGENSLFSALIVDDNFYNRDLSKLALKHVGFQVAEAENGIEALKLLGKQRFDLMLVDLAMPEMNGTQLLRILRDQPVHSRMCIVVMTANPHMATEEIERSAVFIMNKPIDVGEFARFLARLKQQLAADRAAEPIG